MGIPGFTAESSLRHVSAHYQLAGDAAPSAFLVVPALCDPDPPCGKCVNKRQACCGPDGHIHMMPCETIVLPPPCKCTKTTCCSGHCTTTAIAC